MTQCNSLNIKLSNSQLNKLKSAIKNETDVVLRLSSNVIGNSDDETNFPHKLLLINRQVANLRKAFATYLSTDFKLSKTLLSKKIKSRGFLGRRLGSLLKTGLSLTKNVIQPLAKSVLIPLGLTVAASAADAGIHKKILGTFSYFTFNYLVFQPMNRHFKTNTIIYNGGDIILITSWESKGFSKEVIEFPTTSKYLSPELNYVDGKIEVEFTGSCLTRDKIAYTHGTISKHIHCL